MRRSQCTIMRNRFIFVCIYPQYSFMRSKCSNCKSKKLTQKLQSDVTIWNVIPSFYLLSSIDFRHSIRVLFIHLVLHCSRFGALNRCVCLLVLWNKCKIILGDSISTVPTTKHAFLHQLLLLLSSLLVFFFVILYLHNMKETKVTNNLTRYSPSTNKESAQESQKSTNLNSTLTENWPPSIWLSHHFTCSIVYTWSAHSFARSIAHTCC